VNHEKLHAVGQDTVTHLKTLTAVLLLKSPMIDDAFMKTDFLFRLKSLFFARHSNNLVHNYFKDCMVSIIDNLNSDFFIYVDRSDPDLRVET
jgi:hypothetical protein